MCSGRTSASEVVACPACEAAEAPAMPAPGPLPVPVAPNLASGLAHGAPALVSPPRVPPLPVPGVVLVLPTCNLGLDEVLLRPDPCLKIARAGACLLTANAVMLLVMLLPPGAGLGSAPGFWQLPVGVRLRPRGPLWPAVAALKPNQELRPHIEGLGSRPQLFASSSSGTANDTWRKGFHGCTKASGS